MNNYQSPIPRVAFGIAAVALTTGTFALFVVMPAMIGSGNEGGSTQAAAKPVTPTATEVVTIIPGRIEVLGVRETELASTPPTTLTLVKADEADRADLRSSPPAPRVREYKRPLGRSDTWAGVSIRRLVVRVN